jgi:hypothetical protein
VSAAPPQLRLAVGVVVERRKPVSPWSDDVLWTPVAVLAGAPAAQPWTPLSAEGDTARFYAGAAEIELYRTEVDNYRRNLASGSPSVWVALEVTEAEPPCQIVAVTADPAEGEGFTEAGQAIVEAVAMPEALRDEIAAFVAAHPAPPPAFTKRQRDRADPEALARRGPRFRGDR